MSTATNIKIGLAIAGGIALFLVARKAGQVAGDVVHAVNPLNNDNIINRGFTDVYQTVTGSDGTLGTDIYDFTHPTAAEGTNVINGAATSIYQKITGSKGSIGTDLYDWLHPEPTVPAAPPVDNTVLDARDAMARRGTVSPDAAYYGDPRLNALV